MDYFYDQQFRRYILQFIRIFSDVKIQVSPEVFRRVPVKYGHMSRMVAMLMRDNSQNTIMQAPQMSAHVGSIELAPERRKDTTFVRKTRAVERAYDKQSQTYTSEPGNRYSVESPMPVPYTLNMNLDVWSSNTTDKFQILEQILTVFNPGVQIQTNDNPLDWTSIFEVELTGITWSSAGVPAGVDSANDIATLQFRVPVWISLPSKVSRQKVIQTIVTNVFAANVESADLRDVLDPLNSCFDRLKQTVITPDNLSISVESAPGSTHSVVRLLGSNSSWDTLAGLAGNVSFNGGLLTLKTHDDLDSTQGDVLGTVTQQGDVLHFEVDTDTLPGVSFHVNAVIDPVVSWPGNGLPAAAAGTKYLLVDNSSRNNGEEFLIPVDTGTSPWGSTQANRGDIIEYDGAQWQVVFSSADTDSVTYARNLSDGEHYQFQAGEWSLTYLGEYTPGFWRLEV